MRKHERVKAALTIQQVDRPPYGFWTHLPGIDLDAAKLAEATLAFARRYDLDFIKSMPNNLYAVEDWGCLCDYAEVSSGGAGKVLKHGVAAPEDWQSLALLGVAEGALGRELDHLGRLVAGADRDWPVLATVFSPLTIAKKLAGAFFHRSVVECPDRLEQGLERISEVMRRFVVAALERGVAGIFFATQEASFDALSLSEFRRFGAPYDAPILAAARRGGWFNILHLHGVNVMVDEVRDYPVDALSWHIGETAPEISDYASRVGRKPVLGGLVRGDITQGNLGALRLSLGAAMAATGGRGLLLGPGCSIRHPVADSVLQEAAAMIKNLEWPSSERPR